VQCFCRAEWCVVGVGGECSLSTELFRRLCRAVSEIGSVSLTCGVVHRTTITSPFVLTAAMASARVFSSSPMPTANDAPTMAAATASLVANRGMAGSSTQDGSSLFSAHQSSQVKSSQSKSVCLTAHQSQSSHSFLFIRFCRSQRRSNGSCWVCAARGAGWEALWRECVNSVSHGAPCSGVGQCVE
jgi:hypothetical protein